MFINIVTTVFRLIASPRKGWERICEKDEELHYFTNNFLFPIFGLIALATFVGGLWFTADGNIPTALRQTIVVVSAIFGGFYIAAYLLNELFPRFGLAKSLPTAQQFVGYTSVVAYILFLVEPFLSGFPLLWIAAIYTFSVAFAGSGVYLVVEDGKRNSFSAIASLIVVLLPPTIKFVLQFLIK